MPSPHRRGLDGPAPARKRAVWLALCGGFLVALALAVSAALTLSIALSPEAFAAMAGDGFDRTLTVERVQLELHPRPWIRAEGVEIEGLGGAGAAEVQLRLRPLLRGRIRAHLVRLEAAHLVLRRGPDGDFLPIFRSNGGEAGLAALPRFEAESGEVRIVQGEKLTAVVRLQSLALGHFDSAHRADLVVVGNVTAGDGKWHVHPLHVHGQLVHASERLALEAGRAQAHYVGAKWWRGHDARARFSYQDGVVRFASLDVRAYGGRWSATGDWRLRGGMQLDLSARAEGVQLAAVAAAASPGSTPGDLGVLRMRWSDLRIPWRDGPRWERATGQGHLRVAGGILPGHSILARAVGASAGANAVSFLTAPVDLGEGRLSSQEVQLESEDYVLSAGGTLGIDSSLELEGRVRLTGTVLPPIPVTIAGRLMEPTLDAHPSRVAGVGTLTTGVARTGEGVARTTRAAGRGVQGAIGALGTAGRKAKDLLDGDG